MTRYRIPMYKLSMVRDGSVCADRRVVSNSQDLSPLLVEYFKDHDREDREHRQRHPLHRASP